MDVLDEMDHVCDLPPNSKSDEDLAVQFPIKDTNYIVKVKPIELQYLCTTFKNDWIDELTDLFIYRNVEHDTTALQSQFCGNSYERNEVTEE